MTIHTLELAKHWQQNIPNDLTVSVRGKTFWIEVHNTSHNHLNFGKKWGTAENSVWLLEFPLQLNVL